MLNIEKWKVVLTILVCLLGIAYAAPNLMPSDMQQKMEQSLPDWLPTKTVNLGLDLRGGSHLLLEADLKPVLQNRMEAMESNARKELRAENIGYTDLRSNAEGVTFKLRDPEKDGDAAVKVARGLEHLAAVKLTPEGVVSVQLDEVAMRDITAQIVNQSIEIVRRRVDETGTKEPIIQRQGENRIVLQLPGVDNPQEVKDLIGKTAKMSFHLVDENAMTTGKPGPGTRKLPMTEHQGQNIVVQARAVIEGERLIDAQPQFDQSGPVVSFRLDSIGAKKFCDVSRQNVGKPFAIVLEMTKDRPEVISAPVIREPICGGSGQISGGFDVKGATQLALLLRSGALPAALSVVEERSVGPSLGSDSVASGKIASGVAFVAVALLMIASYGLFGLFAVVALGLNLVLIFAVLSLLQATLTLPGIAAIILTMGIGVDANVLVYERIREELRHGRSVLSSIDTGYRHALRTIFDSNLTTLIVAIILFSFGSGPVKGFAVAMSIGIITSLFAALMVTRLIIIGWLRKAKPVELHL
ncbi:MAG TPA: protein translocase subunit SecD [Patescibacteria group bacterium]|nr:protein translocase subunit SecD [Patescibacteria group bacterium]